MIDHHQHVYGSKIGRGCTPLYTLRISINSGGVDGYHLRPPTCATSGVGIAAGDGDESATKPHTTVDSRSRLAAVVA